MVSIAGESIKQRLTYFYWTVQPLETLYGVDRANVLLVPV